MHIDAGVAFAAMLTERAPLSVHSWRVPRPPSASRHRQRGGETSSRPRRHVVCSRTAAPTPRHLLSRHAASVPRDGHYASALSCDASGSDWGGVGGGRSGRGWGNGGGGDDGDGDEGRRRNGTAGFSALQLAAATLGSPPALDSNGEAPTAEDLQRIRRLLREVFRDLTDAKQRCVLGTVSTPLCPVSRQRDRMSLSCLKMSSPDKL